MRIERGGAGKIGWRCRVRGGGGSVDGGDGSAAGFPLVFAVGKGRRRGERWDCCNWWGDLNKKKGFFFPFSFRVI